MSGVKHTGWKADCGFHRHSPALTCSVRITSGVIQVKTEGEARLIAAAPEMFDYILSSAQNGCATAQQIIARARGEQDGGGHV